MAAFKRCDHCARTVGWNDAQERRTWLELHWDVLDDGHPEQVWDFCSWDCCVNFGLSRRRGPVSDLVRDFGDRVIAAGTAEEDYLSALDQERARCEQRRTAAQRDVRQLLDELERTARGDSGDAPGRA
jgi:hypothetical protein